MILQEYHVDDPLPEVVELAVEQPEVVKDDEPGPCVYNPVSGIQISK